MMGFWSRLIDPNRTASLVTRLEARLERERAETAQMRRQRANTIQAVQSGARAIETMGNMLRMVTDE